MGGFAGSILRGLGQTGSDISTGQQNITQQKVQSQKDQLDLMRSRIQLQQLQDGIRGQLRQALGREPTDAEVQQYMGIAPKAPAAPTSPYSDYKVGDDGRMYGVRKDTGVLEPIPAAPRGGPYFMQGAGQPPTFPIPDQKTPRATTQPRFETREMTDPNNPKDKTIYQWQYDEDGSLAKQLQAQGQPVVRYGPYIKMGIAKEDKPQSSIPKYSSVFTDEDPKSPNYGQRIGINSLTGKEEIIKAPEGTTAAKPSKASASGAKTPTGAASALNDYLKLKANLETAKSIQSGNLNYSTSKTLAGYTKSAAPGKTPTHLWGLWGGNPQSFTPDEAKQQVALLENAVEAKRKEVIQLYQGAGMQPPEIVAGTGNEIGAGAPPAVDHSDLGKRVSQ